MSWPTILTGQNASLLSTLWQFERTELMQPNHVLHYQLLQASVLLDHSRKTVPFYSNRLASFSAESPISMKEWRQIPVLTRQQVQEYAKDLESTEADSLGKHWYRLTSGSTGVPVRTMKNEVTHFFWRCFALRDHFWHARDFSKRLAVLREGDESLAGRISQNWGEPTRGLFPTGECGFFPVTKPIDLQFEWLKQFRPNIILTYPSNVAAIAQYALSTKQCLEVLEEVRTFGEVLNPQTRALCHSVWGVPVRDVYSAQEVGYIALQCPSSNCYHVQSENLLVEVVRSDGSACQPGDEGRLLVTDLHNFAMPLIRYEIGDIVTLGENNCCDRSLPVLLNIKGRSRNMLVLPSGQKIWPSMGDEETLLRAKIPIAQKFQFVQEAPTKLRILVVVEKPWTTTEEDRVRRFYRDRWHHAFDITIDYVEDITRSPSGKYEDFLSTVDR